MIPKASRKERMNLSVAAGTAYSVTVYTVSSNRTLILTDVLFETNDGGEGLYLYDGTSAATPTAGTEKMSFRSNPVRITDIQHGPEFATGVAAALIGNRALPTYSVKDFWMTNLMSSRMDWWVRKVKYISDVMQVNPCISFFYCS